MRGRKKEPTRLHEVKGTTRRDRANDAEPVPPPRPPQIPAWLDGRSRAGRLWKEIGALLDEMGVMTSADEHAVAMLCDALSEYVECREYVKKHGLTYESVVMVEVADGEERERRIVRPRPEVAMYQDAFKRVKSLLPEFGLTPSARARLKAEPKKAPDELADFLSSRKSKGKGA